MKFGISQFDPRLLVVYTITKNLFVKVGETSNDGG
jgi:hypothetical protein